MISKALRDIFRTRTIFVALIIIIFVSTQSALASFVVERSIIDEDVTPGVPLNEKIALRNEGTSTDLNVEISVFGFGQGPDGSILLLEADEDKGPYSARGYITVSENEIALKPEWDDEVDVDIEVPAEMGDGSRYAVIQFKIPEENKTTGKARDWGVLVPVLLTNSNSNLIRTGEITDLSVKWPSATVLFKNNGNTHLRPTIKTIIKDSKGQLLKELSTDTAISIIPGFSRRYIIELGFEDDLIPGDYILEVSAGLDEGNIVLDGEEKEFKINQS